jgi:hypothetical protein
VPDAAPLQHLLFYMTNRFHSSSPIYKNEIKENLYQPINSNIIVLMKPDMFLNKKIKLISTTIKHSKPTELYVLRIKSVFCLKYFEALPLSLHQM